MQILLVLLSAAGAALAAQHNGSPLHLFSSRDEVQVPCADNGEKDCGPNCIPISYTCCADGSGGCPPGNSCFKGINNQYGCCPDGKVCNGAGGATTVPGSVSFSTYIANATATMLYSNVTMVTTVSTTVPCTTSSSYAYPTKNGSTTATSTYAVVTAGAAKDYGIAAGLPLVIGLAAAVVMF